MSGKAKNTPATQAAATEAAAAESMPPEAYISQLEQENQKLRDALNDLQSRFDEYREQAQQILKEAAEEKIIQTNKPVIRHGGRLYSFKMGVFHIDGKRIAAADIIKNPGAYEQEIELLKTKFNILKPFKAE
jgi:hypothetical protein